MQEQFIGTCVSIDCDQVSCAMTASNEQTSLVVKPKQNEYVSFETFDIILSQAIASLSSSSRTAVIWGRCFLSSWQQALHMLQNLLRKWLVAGIIGGTLKEPHMHLLHDLDSIQPRPHPSLSKQLNVKAAKGMHQQLAPYALY